MASMDHASAVYAPWISRAKRSGVSMDLDYLAGGFWGIRWVGRGGFEILMTGPEGELPTDEDVALIVVYQYDDNGELIQDCVEVDHADLDDFGWTMAELASRYS